MYGNLFVSNPTNSDLVTFVNELFLLLNVCNFEERESMNYPPSGHYVLFKCLGLEFHVFDVDDDMPEYYKFNINMKPDGFKLDDKNTIENFSDIVARKLVMCGYRVARSPNIEQENATFLEYILNIDENNVKSISINQSII